MVPTELLAVQHYEHLVSLLENIGGDQSKPSVALLTGSTSAKQSRIILKACLFLKKKKTFALCCLNTF